MKHKVTLLLSMAAAAAAAVLVTRLITDSHAPNGKAPDGTELAARLQRLEAQIPAVKRSLGQAAAQAGAVALARAASAADDSDEGTPEAEARERQREIERAQKQAHHYDRLDALARAGGGTDAAAQLRKNIADARSLPSPAIPGELDITRLDCSDQLCRVEVRLTATMGRTARTAVRILMTGMGNLSQRPSSPGQPAVFYVAAPGHRLPRLEL